MPLPEYYPYRSEAARARCFAYFDSKAASTWPRDSEERYVPTSYGPTFVRLTGPPAAPPLVLLHGAGGTSLMWAPNVQALSEHYRTIAVDQAWDFGRTLSTKPIETMSDLTSWLNELFDGLKVRSGINLAGMSYGGAIAAQYALRFPRRLRNLVLLAPGNTVLRTCAAFWPRVIAMAVFRRRAVPSFMRWVFPDMTRKDPGWVDGIVSEMFLNMESMVRRRPLIPPVLTDTEWRSLDVRTLFLVGEHDVIYPPRKAVARLARTAPSVTPEIVPGAGHDLTAIQAEAVNRRILDFLAHPAANVAMAS